MKGIVIVFVLLGVFVYSAMELITVRYEQRLLYNEIVRVQNAAQKMHQEWSYLQLERANLTSTVHMDTIMRQKLKMQTPAIDQIIYIKESDLKTLPATDVMP